MREWLRTLDGAAREAVRQMGAELKQMVAHGAHEFSAGLLNGSAYVMYPRGHYDNPQISNAEHGQQQSNNAGHEHQNQIEREM